METTETSNAPENGAPAAEPTNDRCVVALDAGMSAGSMACPVCGHEMPDLKGGKATICPACGFKDSCCY